MKLYWMRHGKASWDAATDEARELTEHGRHDVRKNAEKLAKELKEIDTLLVSPIVRTRQTAEEVCDELGIKVKPVFCDWLIHETPPAETIAALAAIKFKKALVVSHQPLSSAVIEKLCGLPRGDCPMETSSIAVLKIHEVAPGCAELVRVVHR